VEVVRAPGLSRSSPVCPRLAGAKYKSLGALGHSEEPAAATRLLSTTSTNNPGANERI